MSITAEQHFLSKTFSKFGNTMCFDCCAMLVWNAWVSINYGVSICKKCADVHRSLGLPVLYEHAEMSEWNRQLIRRFAMGGNKNAWGFFYDHGCKTDDIKEKYSSTVAQLYSEKLSEMMQLPEQ